MPDEQLVAGTFDLRFDDVGVLPKTLASATLESSRYVGSVDAGLVGRRVDEATDPG